MRPGLVTIYQGEDDPKEAVRRFNDVLEAFWPGTSKHCTTDDKLCLISQHYGCYWHLAGISKRNLIRIGVSQGAEVAILAAKRESKTL